MTTYTMSTNAIQHEGKSFPLGATLAPGRANFSVFAKHNSAVQLLLFDDVDAPKPSRVIDLDRRTNRTYHYWHAFVPGVAEPLAPILNSTGVASLSDSSSSRRTMSPDFSF